MDELNTVRVIDPRLDINSSRLRTYGIFDGAGQITWKQYISTSFNNAQISFTCNPPNERIYVNRKLYIQTTFRLTFTGPSPGDNVALLQAKGLPTLPGVNPGSNYQDAPRCLPFANACSTAQIQMNNDTISSNLNSYWRIMTRYKNTHADQDGEYSGTPTMPDMSQSYDDLFGFPLNPLAGYGDNVVQCPRGGFVGAVITRNDNGLTVDEPVKVATVELTVFEPFYLSPWSFGAGQETTAFIRLQTINILLTLNGRGTGVLTGLASALWSHAPGGSELTSVTADVLGSRALFSYLTPDITQPIPQVINYSYFEPNFYPTSSATEYQPGESTVLQMNTVNLKSIPNRMYIFVYQRDQDVNIESTDTYWAIDNLNVTFINQDGLFANATQYDLFQMSREAGCNLSWRQFTLSVGSVVCVQFGIDLPLGALQAPGLRGNFSLSMSVRCTNILGKANIPTLGVLVINEGVMTIDHQTVIRSVGVLNEKDILASKELAPVGYRPSQNVYGSGFWSRFASLFKDPAKKLRMGLDAAKVLAPANPYINALDAGAKVLGYGKKPKGRKSKDEYVGGARIPRRDLLALLGRDEEKD